MSNKVIALLIGLSILTLSACTTIKETRVHQTSDALKSVRPTQRSTQRQTKNDGHSNLGVKKKQVEVVQAEIKSNRPDDNSRDIVKALGTTPEGFRWVLFRGVALMRPISWHEYSLGNTYCSSIESVPDNGKFETGVTVQVLRNIRKKTKVSPTQAAILILKGEQKKENTKLLMNSHKYDDIETLVYRYRNAPKGMEPIIVHQYFQINEKEDFINIITFETTEAKWDTYWNNQGKIILGKIAAIPYFE